MADGFVHTVYKNDQWVVEIEGNGEVGSHSTKDDAVAQGRAQAQQSKTEHLIHNQDGTISERNSYGEDSASRPG
jgi:Uncharacterized protein conserved in bacteria (DUF2188)